MRGDDRRRTTQAPRASLLSAATTSVSDQAVLDWCTRTAERVRSALDPSTIELGIRAYRHCGDHLAADLNDASGAATSLHFHADGDFVLGERECSVPDLVEALHIIGMIADALDLKVSVGEPCHQVLVRQI